ncbi:DUF3404 domain-containing protein [Enterovibrio nigricans]|uniref:histidine kinase n=1 Tax=Enterovibrio nigricans DSM 22720 TaxID=1121868 RepID=A0A1T4V5N6_9GAMM|nr:DUF3404 domain-containing protein [Enterovibrio nigricans]SKA60162.1 Histidine kinase-, DNA gyrase B-, and HSP90-like ATPase [Enterovibrio nigricans DSM 22720]
MRKLIAALFLIVHMPAWANASFPEQLNKFRSSLLHEKPIAEYSLNAIHSEYPKALLISDSLLPQSTKYPLKDLKRLYQAAQKCAGPWPVSPLVTDPLVFTRAMCFNTRLPSVWFSRSNLIHPGGGSYAAKYVEKFPERSDELLRFFHIKERLLAPPETLLGQLQRMPENGINALNGGAETLLSNDELWLRKGSEYRVYSPDIWMPLLERLDLLASPTDNKGYCLSRIGNVCWNQQQAPSYWSHLVIGLAIVNLLWIAGWVFNRWTVKRRLIQERMLVLQILTHELRTPIASLSMTVEGFRRKFDSLPEPLYDEFRRLCEDSMRLKQLAEASKDYLQSNQQQLVRETIPSLEEWLGYLCEERGVGLDVKEDGPVAVNIYWLTTSLDNLISNAKKYGKAPVHVIAQIQNGYLTIKVQDQGQLTAKDWKTIRKPFVSEKGLGLGLTIVESMIERMGGKLTLIGPPTTFILEIPCDPNNAVTH